MALTATMYRFEVELSDVDRGVYETLDLRVAQHPSESDAFMVTRVLAYALEARPDLGFGRGVSTPDDPPISAVTPDGRLELWVEVGAPSAERLHRASKAAGRVVIYSHRDAAFVIGQVRGKGVFGGDRIDVVFVPLDLLEVLASKLDRKVAWSLMRTEGVLYLTVGGTTWEGSLRTERVDP